MLRFHRVALVLAVVCLMEAARLGDVPTGASGRSGGATDVIAGPAALGYIGPHVMSELSLITEVIAISATLGVVIVAQSPAVVVAIRAETGAGGPVARTARVRRRPKANLRQARCRRRRPFTNSFGRYLSTSSVDLLRQSVDQERHIRADLLPTANHAGRRTNG